MMIREAYLGAPSPLSLKFPGCPRTVEEDEERARTARNFRPSGSDDLGGMAPQALVIQRLKASFNIYDLFRFNSTCKREAYLYSAAAWLTGWLSHSLRDVLIPRDLGS